METSVYAVLRAYVSVMFSAPFVNLKSILTALIIETAHICCLQQQNSNFWDTVKRTFVPNQKRKVVRPFVYENVGKNRIIKISRCDLFA